MDRSVTKDLSRSLNRAWNLLPERGRLILNHLSEGDPTGASADSGESLFAYLTILVSWGAKGTKGISLLGVEESRQVVHAHSLSCVLARDYAEPELWGVLGPLPDEGVPGYIKITPPHLAVSCSSLGVLRMELYSDLAGLPTEGDNLEYLGQEPTTEANDSYRQIFARGACLLPSEILGEMYEMGARPTISEVAPQLFASALALTTNNPAYENVLEWVQVLFTKVVWRNHPSLSFLDGPIRTSWSWGASDFKANSHKGRQAEEYIQGRFLGRYDAPLDPSETTSACDLPCCFLLLMKFMSITRHEVPLVYFK